MEFVAYYRVSTQKQGVSGLAAQQQAVAKYIAGHHARYVTASFKEIESGKRSDRPELAKALAECKRCKATLIIAELGSLARNVALISALAESKVELVVCDFPEANCIKMRILAMVAKERGVKLAATWARWTRVRPHGSTRRAN
jgi:DNA invertase Pin-like site-specific DNA recombinase